MTHLLSPFAAQIVQAIGWGLLHSLWQGALIWLLLLTIFRTCPAMSARLKYICALGGFCLLLLWIGSTAAAQWQSSQMIAVRVTAGNAFTNGAYFIQTHAAIHTPALQAPFLRSLHGWMPWLMLCYGIGLLAMSLRLSAGLLRLRGMRTRGIMLPDERLTAMLQRIQLQTGITARVILRISLKVTTPIVIGALRPMILLPASMLEELGTEGLEVILLHELAHIGRADYLVNLLLSVAEAVLFFNPFMWRISVAIRREREHCCDDFVLANTQQPAVYAYTLAGLARRQQGRSSIIAPAATGSSRHPQLFNRIKRIMEMKTQQPARTAQIVTACCLAALIIAVSIACFSPSLAQRSEKSGQSKPATKKNGFADTYKHSRITVKDSNGNWKEWNYSTDKPGGQKETGSSQQWNYSTDQKETSFLQQMQGLDDSLASLKDLGPMLSKSFVYLDDTIRRTALNSLASIDWPQISRQMDSAMKEVSAIDWNAISRDVSRGLAEADRALKDPKLKADMRRAMAMAHTELARNRKEMQQERQEMAEDARRDAADARRDADEARRDAAELRREMEQLRKELEDDRETMKKSSAPERAGR